MNLCMKKRISIIFIIVLAFILPAICAISLDINAKAISQLAIRDINEPAIFELTIKNNGEAENFEIYSLAGIDISPKTFFINDSETKKIKIELMPQDSFKSMGYYTFEYTIKGDSGLRKEILTINLINLEQAFSLKADNIQPGDENVYVYIKNLAGIGFKNINAKINSALFTSEENFDLSANEEKTFEIKLDNEKIKTLSAGPYIINTKLTLKNETANIESIVKFLEQEGIETTENKEKGIITRYEVIKKNQGNVPKLVKVAVTKDIISYLFTTSNINPTETNLNGLKINYVWEKEIIPNEEFRVVVRTNWLFPIIIIILIIIFYIFIKKLIERDLIIRKKVSFVKTRGGEFALKVTLRIRAKKFIERIHVVDKLPPLVGLYNRFGAVSPDKIDEKNKRLEWDIESLNTGEERIFSYIIYSKIGVVGKFELPCARITYEKQGKLKEDTSNRSFYINEPKIEV